MIAFDTIVLGGGGMKCIATLGAIQYVYDYGCPHKIRKYSGTSAGSMICLLLIVGYTPIELVVYICTQRVVESLLPADIVSLIKGCGALAFEKIERHIRKMVSSKLGKDVVTLKELHELTDKTLICATYNMTKNACEYVSFETHPDLDCVTAVRMSSSIPIVFAECIVNGDLYLDGGVVDNFPISVVKPDDTVFGCVLFTKYDRLDKNRIIGLLRIVTSVSSNFYIQRMISTYTAAKILTIFLENTDVFDFELTSVTRLDLFSKGYNSAVEFFKNSTNK